MDPITSDVPSIAFRLCRLVLLFSLEYSHVPNRNSHTYTFTHSKWVSSISYKPVRAHSPSSTQHPCIHAYHTPHAPNDILTSIFRARALPSRAALRPPQAPQHLLHRRTIRRRGIRLQHQHRCQFTNQHNLETINRKLASIREKWAFGIAVAVLIS